MRLDKSAKRRNMAVAVTAFPAPFPHRRAYKTWRNFPIFCCRLPNTTNDKSPCEAFSCLTGALLFPCVSGKIICFVAWRGNAGLASCAFRASKECGQILVREIQFSAQSASRNDLTICVFPQGARRYAKQGRCFVKVIQDDSFPCNQFC